ncbi:FYVE, RhoGEF and PH domain-containing protein 5 [Galemys pyrenaicus]|uniref:FYVE, RhoGEF and PH domain-containing protein 5 n=1 Tax=Galemys pyrenaicus TaxID=202257 RepID=A0A8J6AAA3_GALPY|nr:FYVE, RhoGEF and PH domain-containing protein 5 [Galemys pyrenaicus]
MGCGEESTSQLLQPVLTDALGQGPGHSLQAAGRRSPVSNSGAPIAHAQPGTPAAPQVSIIRARKHKRLHVGEWVTRWVLAMAPGMLVILLHRQRLRLERGSHLPQSWGTKWRPGFLPSRLLGSHLPYIAMCPDRGFPVPSAERKKAFLFGSGRKRLGGAEARRPPQQRRQRRGGQSAARPARSREPRTDAPPPPHARRARAPTSALGPSAPSQRGPAPSLAPRAPLALRSARNPRERAAARRPAPAPLAPPPRPAQPRPAPRLAPAPHSSCAPCGVRRAPGGGAGARGAGPAGRPWSEAAPTALDGRTDAGRAPRASHGKMNRAESPKPPVAPKPRTASPFAPVTAPKLPPSPRPESLHSPNSMSRGPKPPIAPKPRLAAPHEWRASVYVINSLNKCSNGKLLCVDRGLYDEPRPGPECSERPEPEAGEDYIVAPRAPPSEDEDEAGPGDGDCAEKAAEPLGPAEEEEQQGRGEGGMGATEDLGASAEAALSREGDEDPVPAPEGPEEAEDSAPEGPEEAEDSAPEGPEGAEDSAPEGPEGAEDSAPEGPEGAEDSAPEGPEGAEDSAGDPGAEEQEPAGEQGEKLAGEHSPELPRPGEADSRALAAGLALEAEDDGEDLGPEPRGLDGVDSEPPGEGAAADASGEPTEQEELAAGAQESGTADSPAGSASEEERAEGTGGLCQDEAPERDEDTAAVTLEAGGAPREGAGPGEEELAEESCHIVPFENGCVDDFAPPLSGGPYQFFPTESTSFCSESYAPALPESPPGLAPEQEPESGGCAEQDLAAGPPCGREGPCASGKAAVPEAGPVDDALTNPYEMDPDCGVALGDAERPTPQAAPGPLSGPGETAGSDAEGDLLPPDAKDASSRARPHSGKLTGYVPETVPEEAGPDAGAGAVSREARRTALSLEGRPPEASRALPAKPRAFTLYPRSFSVEGREIPVSVYREPEGPGLDDHRVKRKEDGLPLPCLIGSSGSFSQRNHLPSSGTSTPSSVVDIPPPFDLACITKKPITKSSPSLLIESEPPDKHPKKKKSSFKRFLALTFKKKSENKVHVEVNLSSSRSSSESSYHGPSRLLEMDRRSLSNSPQLKARTGKLRASESPSSLIFYRDGKRKGLPFSRTVSRVESFEDRSRPPFLPLPLTKPRSISFPNADTSDYENIPAMNSDYENIQIPPRRPGRAGTFTKLFEDQSRALSTANENDGYVDMSSFNAFESKQQSADQDAESSSAKGSGGRSCLLPQSPREFSSTTDASARAVTKWRGRLRPLRGLGCILDGETDVPCRACHRVARPSRLPRELEPPSCGGCTQSSGALARRSRLWS